MGMFTRLTDIVSANLNALLDRLENPERMLTQLIREMEETLSATRQHAVAILAEERRLARDGQHHQDAADGWQAKARLALQAGRDDLARRALARRLEHLDDALATKSQHEIAKTSSDQMKVVLHALDNRLAAARRHLRLLQAGRHSKEVQRAWSAAAGLGDLRSPFVRFANLERRLIELEDNLTLHAQLASLPAEALEDELGKLNSQQCQEQALAALQREIGRPASESDPEAPRLPTTTGIRASVGQEDRDASEAEAPQAADSR